MPKPVILKLAHDLYQRFEEGAPKSICDDNGEVVLGLCKVCGRGESELYLDKGCCPGKPNKGIVPVTVNTDGSASYKAGNGGWSIVVKKGKELAELYGFSDRSTIGEMELLPIHNALEWLPIGPSPIRFFCDSQYAVNTLNVWALEWKRQGWFVGQLKRPSHWKLIKRIMELLDKHREHRAVAIIWMPREHNKHADKLAGEARRGRLTNYSL